MDHFEKHLSSYTVSTDPSRLDVVTIHAFLSNESGWARNIPYERVEKSIANSLNFGVYSADGLVGFARIVSDYATTAYLGDVFILPEFRGLGLSKLLMDTIMEHPQLQGLRRWVLLTSTADWLYRKYGFTAPSQPELYMEKYDPSFAYAPTTPRD